VLIEKKPRSDKYAQHRYSLFQSASVSVADWENDGDMDLVIGTIFGQIYLLTNAGYDGGYSFEEPKLLHDGSTGEVKLRKAGPHMADLDGDGDLDLLVGTESNGLYLLRNDGTRAKPKLSSPQPVMPGGKPLTDQGYRPKLDTTDWNGDGVLDLLVGTCVSQETAEGKRTTSGFVWLCLGKKPSAATKSTPADPGGI